MAGLGSYAPGSVGYASGPAGKARPGNQMGSRKAPSSQPVSFATASRFNKRGALSRGKLGKRGR